MEDPPEPISSSKLLDLEDLRSRVSELTDLHRRCKDEVPELTSSDSDKLLKDCALHLQSRVDHILSEYSDVESFGNEDLDAYFKHLQEELKLVEAENAKISSEIEALNYLEDLNRLESDLEELKYSSDFNTLQEVGKAKVSTGVGTYTCSDDQLSVRNAPGEDEIEILKLNDQIEKNNIILKSLQDLDHIYKRFEAIEKIEDAMSGLKVLDFDNNRIRLSLRTYVPNLEGLSCLQENEASVDPSELNHELLIDVMDGNMELKSVEIFPNDVYIGEIVDAAKSSRQLFSHLSMLETRSSLEWFVRKVQERIILCTLRKCVVKSMNRSRHSFEYLDRDELIVVHMVEGISAFIKVPQSWPISNSALKLLSLKSSDHHSKGISLSFLSKVEEMANSLDVLIRQNISSFVDAIGEILLQQKGLEHHSDAIPRK